MTPPRLIATAVVGGLLAALATAASAQAVTTTYFHTPSKSIYCIYITDPTFLRCDTMYPTRFSGTRTCQEGDFGQAFGMTRRGHARARCASDSTVGPGKTLKYGTTRRFGPYRCTSRHSGLICTNKAKHGWLLSRQKQKLF